MNRTSMPSTLRVTRSPSQISSNSITALQPLISLLFALCSLLSILPNSTKPKQRLALSSRSRHNLALRIRCQSADEVSETSDGRIGSRSPLRYPPIEHLAVIRALVDGELNKCGTPATTPLRIETQI